MKVLPSGSPTSAVLVKPIPGSVLGSSHNSPFNLTVLIAGLGYFVDTFDIFLYNSMRTVSLTELGLSGQELTQVGILILNCMIFGALLGSFVWGILGDRIGRKKAMLGSIALYSLGMLANSLVQTPLDYALSRFIIGFGVAGEVGLGATLVAETILSSKRTYALTLFTVMGVLGVTAAGAGLEFIHWRKCCLLGGLVGLLLLTLRSRLFESQLFAKTAQSIPERGSLKQLLGNAQSRKKYLLCIPLLGANFFVTGILLTLAPEVGRATGAQETIKANIALAVYFFCAMFGDFLGAWLSDTFKSRRLVAGMFVIGNALLALLLLQKLHLDSFGFYTLCAAFGIFNMWAITGAIVVEQFPTKLRATATTTNFNLSRATVILMNMAFLWLKPMGAANALLLVGMAMFALAIFCVWRLPETYGCTLDA